MSAIQLIKSPFQLKKIDQQQVARQVAEVTRFYQTVPFYQPTPLVSLDHYAKGHRVGQVFVKDEGQRFDDRLKSFKVTGGLYAMACQIAKRAGLPIDGLTYDQLQDPAVKQVAGQMTFYTATDGNHGRGIAWAAAKLGTHAVVKMPAPSTQVRADHIRQFANCDVEITPDNYDDTVQLASRLADKDPQGVLVQDMAWDGYHEIPAEISAGYSVVATEVLKQLAGQPLPTHVFLQAGVGQMSSGLINALLSQWPTAQTPTITIVEPATVDCYFESATVGDGQPHTIPGSPATIMAGLNCQTPSAISWPVIKQTAAFYGTLTDGAVKEGMKQLARPTGNDPLVIAGESGVAGFAFVHQLLTNPAYRPQRNELGLDQQSRILVINTEGDTDEPLYQRIIEE
ncbi:diaminopropionate ammonia-lyase [uncultured Limosilactobacillus sp.]|uniref:diaminopropionate ammonia-lyase n=1 Tax=uncultured Limosilactobacillus sp. TaxID=2837629 RepID=UPI0025DE67C2|nr:diaminopropionate ammonia-lyase [uncultured Limosilactobacillus sp.]